MKDSGAPHGPLLGELPTAPERLCPGSWRNVSSSSCRCSRLGKTAGLKKHEKKRRRTHKQTPQKHTNTHRLLAPRARRDTDLQRRGREAAHDYCRERRTSPGSTKNLQAEATAAPAAFRRGTVAPQTAVASLHKQRVSWCQ